MVIEAKDSFIGSIRNGVSPLRAITGERSWSELTKKKEVSEMEAVFLEEHFTADGPDHLIYGRTFIRLGKRYDQMGDGPKREDINDPSKPWYGKIRWRDTSPTAEIS